MISVKSLSSFVTRGTWSALTFVVKDHNVESIRTAKIELVLIVAVRLEKLWTEGKFSDSILNPYEAAMLSICLMEQLSTLVWNLTITAVRAIRVVFGTRMSMY